MDPPPYMDDLPCYSPSLSYFGVALIKPEFDTPWASASGPLRPVVLELNSSQLNIYEFADKSLCPLIEALFLHQNYRDAMPKAPALENEYLFDGDAYGDGMGESGPSVLSKLKKAFVSRKTDKRLAQVASHTEFAENGMLLEPTSDIKTYEAFARKYRGRILHSLTLQNLQVGEAPSLNLRNYKEESVVHSLALVRYRNTLRLRIEHRQILLHLWSFHGMVHWFRNLCIGRDLGSLLDNRVVSRLKSIPRNFSSANNALLEAAALEAAQTYPHSGKINMEFDQATIVSSNLSSSSLASASTGVGTSMSLASRWTSLCTSIDDSRQRTEIFGASIVSFEEYYNPMEKHYISSCIPTLNSYDKWEGSKMTLSNYTHLLPNNDANNVNEKGRTYISQVTLASLVKIFHKKFATLPHSNQCKDFWVGDTGLVSLEALD